MKSIKSASIMAAVRSIFLRLTPEVIDHVVSKVDIEIRSAYCYAAAVPSNSVSPVLM